MLEIVKNSSPIPSVGQLSADKLQTVSQQTANSQPTVIQYIQ